MIEALAPNFDYESHPPYSILVVNIAGMPESKGKKTLRKAISWMFDTVGSDVAFNSIIDAAGCVIYLGSRKQRFVIATEECFKEMEHRANLSSDYDDLMQLIFHEEMKSRVAWPESSK